MTAGKYNHYKIRHKKIERLCKYCSSVFICLPNSIKKYCLLTCYHKTMKGIPLPKKAYENNRGFTGKKHNPETIGRIISTLKKYKFTGEHIKNLKKARKNQVRPIKDTSIEVKIQTFLKELNIDFFTHQYIKIEHGYQCDIFIPSINLVIECDGDYWHKYPIGREIDDIRTKELIENGFKVLRLWERDIRVMSINKFKQRIGDLK